MANKGNVATSTEAAKPKGRPMMVVGMDMTSEELLRLDAEGLTDFVFDSKEMPVYEDSIVQEFGHELKKAYFMAYADVKKRREDAAVRSKHQDTPPQLWVEDPFERVAVRTETLVKKREAEHKGWHATWVRGDQMATFKEVGYKEIREPKPGDAIGAENGEWIKIVESDKITIYFMEIPTAVHDQIMKAASYKSQVRYSHDIESTYRQYLEGVNRDVGSRREQIVPVVDNTDQREVLTRE